MADTSTYPTGYDGDIKATVPAVIPAGAYEFFQLVGDAISKLEIELGLNPSGDSATVTARLAAMSALIEEAATPPSPSSATPQPLGSAAAGSATTYSRGDHVHALPTIPALTSDTPQPLGSAAAGNAATSARANHVHAMPSQSDIIGLGIVGNQAGSTSTTAVQRVRVLTATDYAALSPAAANTLYLIVTVSGGNVTGLTGLAYGAHQIALEGGGGPGNLVWRGPWADATSYTADDLVAHGGATYICTDDHTSASGTEPGEGGSWETVWDLFLAPPEGGGGGGWASPHVVYYDPGEYLTDPLAFASFSDAIDALGELPRSWLKKLVFVSLAEADQETLGIDIGSEDPWWALPIPMDAGGWDLNGATLSTLDNPVDRSVSTAAPASGTYFVNYNPDVLLDRCFLSAAGTGAALFSFPNTMSPTIVNDSYIEARDDSYPVIDFGGMGFYSCLAKRSGVGPNSFGWTGNGNVSVTTDPDYVPSPLAVVSPDDNRVLYAYTAGQFDYGAWPQWLELWGPDATSDYHRVGWYPRQMIGGVGMEEWSGDAAEVSGLASIPRSARVLLTEDMAFTVPWLPSGIESTIQLILENDTVDPWGLWTPDALGADPLEEAEAMVTVAPGERCVAQLNLRGSNSVINGYDSQRQPSECWVDVLYTMPLA